MNPAARSEARRAVIQADHLVFDFQFFSLEAGKEQVVRQGAVHLSVDLLLEKGMLISKALDVVLHGHPFAILQLESLTTLQFRQIPFRMPAKSVTVQPTNVAPRRRIRCPRRPVALRERRLPGMRTA